MVIVDIKKPKKCIWYEDGQDCKCPLLDDNDCCRGQGNEANSAANDWDDLMKGCPIKSELPEEHGDLIDRDIMYKEIELWKSTATDTITLCFLYHIERLLMSIRPTIAAERKDE